jgi:hypothetical protein
MKTRAGCLSALGLPLLLMAVGAGSLPATTQAQDQQELEPRDQGPLQEDSPQIGAGWDEEIPHEPPPDRGRSFLYKEFVVSSSFAQPESEALALSYRPPGSYVALEYIRTFTTASRANRTLPGWLQLSAIDLHPRVVYYGEIPNADSMDMGEGINWPMPTEEEIVFAPQDFWVRFQLAGNDRVSLRIGQIALPYGVNPLLAPRQTFILPVEELDLGLKWDWGIGLKGPFGAFDWELAATLGSGEAWHSPSSLGGSRPSSHLFTGRLGSPTYWNFQYGLSALVGDLPTLHGPYMVDDFPLSRRRLALDASYKKGTYLAFGGQVTYGQDGHAGDEAHVLSNGGRGVADVFGYRAWADWVLPGEKDIRVAGQFESVRHDLDNPQTTDSAAVLEISYSLTTEITIKIDLRTAIEDFMDLDDGMFITFVYYGT